MDISRRAVLAGGAALAAMIVARPAAAGRPLVTVYKSATCGTCLPI